MAICPNVQGRWRMVSAVGFEEFNKELVSKIQQEERHTVEYIKVSDNEYTQVLLYGNNFLQALWLMDYGPLNFTIGSEYTHKDLSGSDSRSTVNLEGITLTQVQKIGQGEEGVVEIEILRTFEKNTMTTTYSATGFESQAVLQFERIPEVKILC